MALQLSEHYSKSIESLEYGDHICQISNSLKQKFHSLARFFSQGLKVREKCLFLASSTTTSDVHYLLEQFGLDASEAVGSGDLRLVDMRNNYVINGAYFLEHFLEFTQKYLYDAVSKGYSGLRVVTDIEVNPQSSQQMDNLFMYEEKLNYLVQGRNIICICQFDRWKLSPRLIDMLANKHPMVLKNDEIVGVSGDGHRPVLTMVENFEKDTPRKNRNNGHRGYRATVDRIRENIDYAEIQYNLTNQEKRVIELVLRCKSNEEIADMLFISINTVKQHIKNIFNKLQIRKRTDLFSIFMKNILFD